MSGGGMGSGTGSSKVDTVAARLSLDPLTVAEGITESSFPNQGITCRFLERIAADPRMEAPVHTLPIVGPNMQLMPALSLAKLGDLATGPLLEIARAYRVFSEMDGGEEFGRYDGRIQVSNEEVLAALKRPPTTTTQVNICIVKPDSLEARCSYARMLMARGEDVGLVGRPTVFLSHAWRYAFRDVVQAVVERFGAVNNGVFIWNDIFVEDQNSSDGKPEDYFYTAFKSAITTIGHTVVVFQPWADPLPMTRAWCIFEMYSAMTSGVRLDVVLPETEKASLRAAVLADPSAVNKVLVDVDANKAECFKEEDRVQIFAAIDMMPGGMHRLNAEMKGMLRKWAVSTVHDFCGSEADADATATATATTAQDREALAELGLLYHNVGSILREDGDFTGALALMKRSVAAREAALGPDHADVGKSHCGVAFALRSQRNWAEAKPMFEEALAIQIKALGEDHADVAHSYHGLGLVLDLGETLEPSHPEYMQEALRAYRKSLAIRVKVLGARHQRVSTSFNNIAAVLKMQGKTAESYAMYEKALSIKLEVWGPNHPSVGTTLQGMAKILVERGETTEAIALMDTVLKNKLNVMNPAWVTMHPQALMARKKFGYMLRNKGEHHAAVAAFEDLLAIQIDHFGSAHVKVGITYMDIATAVGVAGLGDHERAREFYEKAVIVMASCYEADPDPESYDQGDEPNNGWLQTATIGLGGTYMDLAKTAEGLDDAARAVELFQAAVDTLKPIHEKEPHPEDYDEEGWLQQSLDGLERGLTLLL